MGVSVKITCARCKVEKRVFVGAGQYPRTCHSCNEEIEVEARAKWRETLDTLPLEERIKRIEDYLYDFRRNTMPGIHQAISMTTRF